MSAEVQDTEIDIPNQNPRPEPIDIEIPVVEDAGAPAQAKPDAEASSKRAADRASQIVSADDGLAEMREQLSRARAQAEQARREKLLAYSQVAEARTQVAQSQYGMVTNAIDAETANLENAKRDYIAASEQGDWAKAAEAQTRIGRASAQLVGLEAHKASFDQQAQQQRQQPQSQQQPTQQQPAYVDPVEQWAGRVSPKSAAWIRSNPQVVADERSQKRLIAAHTSAVDLDNLTPDTPEYFSYLEQKMGLAPPARQQQRQQSRSYAAPVTREAPAADGRMSATSVHLTAAEREQAAIEGMSDLEFAKAKIAAMQRYPNYGRQH